MRQSSGKFVGLSERHIRRLESGEVSALRDTGQTSVRSRPADRGVRSSVGCAGLCCGVGPPVRIELAEIDNGMCSLASACAPSALAPYGPDALISSMRRVFSPPATP
jgi:hypothetical protein